MKVELHIQPGPISDYDRLVDYAQRAVKLDHPALVKIVDVGVHAGSPVLIDLDQAKKTAGQVGPCMAGWRAFQPLYDWIVSVQPDLLDE